MFTAITTKLPNAGVAYLALAACLMLGGCAPTDEGVTWILPDATRVTFYHEHSFWQSDHAKCLEITPKNGHAELYKFGESHSGYAEVDLRLSADNRRIWLLDRGSGRIGASFDLSTHKFHGEEAAASAAPAARVVQPSP